MPDFEIHEQEQSRPGMAKAHDGNQGQEEDAHQTPVNLPVQALFQRPDERLQRIGNLQPLLSPQPMLQDNRRSLPVISE